MTFPRIRGAPQEIGGPGHFTLHKGHPASCMPDRQAGLKFCPLFGGGADPDRRHVCGRLAMAKVLAII
jgi:hypothetical protein